MRKKRNKKRLLTAEESARKMELKMKRRAYKYALELAESDPEIRRRMAAQVFGFELPDPAEKSREELLANIDQHAIKRINDNPELQRQITDRRIEQVMKSTGLIADGEEWRKKPPSLDDIIEEFEKFNHLKEVLGIKEPGLLDALMSPELIKAILPILNQLISSKQPPPSNKILVWARGDETDKLFPLEELESLLEEGKAKPLYSIDSEKPDNISKGNDTTPESGNSHTTEGGNEEAGATSTGD